jgi:hypothetical protein
MMKFQKHHLFFIFPTVVLAFMLQTVLWLYERFNRFIMPSSFFFDALLISFIPFAIYWQMKNWATSNKGTRATLLVFWLASMSLIVVYGLSFVLALLG